MAGLEPAASWSRTMRDTKLRHTPSYSCDHLATQPAVTFRIISSLAPVVKMFFVFYPAKCFFLPLTVTRRWLTAPCEAGRRGDSVSRRGRAGHNMKNRPGSGAVKTKPNGFGVFGPGQATPNPVR